MPTSNRTTALWLSVIVTAAASLPGCGQAQVAEAPPWPGLRDSTFGRLIQELSEPERYFDTDNLISNEATYLEVADALPRYGVLGGAYIGVGPGQNFSYLAIVRPQVAFIVDIRRDNLLQHLWYKALFEQAPTRIEFLSLLYGRPPPPGPESWTARPLSDLLVYIDQTPFDSAAAAGLVDRTVGVVERFTVKLSAGDRETIRRIHGRFAVAGPDLRFTTHGRPPRACYPTHRALLLDGGAPAPPGSFLATPERYRVVRDLQQRNLIIPVVGDLAGSHALVAIARYLDERATPVRSFYTSNVEFYLFEDGVFGGFTRNLTRLPTDTTSVIIRSVFTRSFEAVRPGSCSYQSLQRIGTVLEDSDRRGYWSYLDLVLDEPLATR